MGLRDTTSGSHHHHPSMGQRYAKHQMQSGVRLYHERHHQRAIDKWRQALHRLSTPEDRFITLGYIAQAYCDAGDYENMLHYSLKQMELANAKQDNYMKSEAFLNLSKAYERLADFNKAISYGKASLEHPAIDSRTPGYAHLVVAQAFMGFSQFQASLEAFEKAMHVANETGDKLLELQICVGLGGLFTLLRDFSKALIFLRNALTILQLITVDNVHAKYKSIILYHLSVVLRHRGSLGDAREACEEALRLSQDSGSKATYARCLSSLADIYRELGESEAKETITKSWARYEQAFRVMRQIGDRMGEVIVLGSMAKSASESRSHYTGQCECQAIQLNKKCLEIAKAIGCKHAMMKCHQRLAELYIQLCDEDSEEIARKTATSLVQEMELFCNFCGQRYATTDDSLQALRCSHIFHERCLHEFINEQETTPVCPKCRCKAIIMENVSLANSSASSTNENEQQQQSNQLPQPGPSTSAVTPSTSAATGAHVPPLGKPVVVAPPSVRFQPAIVVKSPSCESESASSSRSSARLTAHGSATPVICRVPDSRNATPADSAASSAVVTRNAVSTFCRHNHVPPRASSPAAKPSCMVDGLPALPEEVLYTGPDATNV